MKRKPNLKKTKHCFFLGAEADIDSVFSDCTVMQQHGGESERSGERITGFRTGT